MIVVYIAGQFRNNTFWGTVQNIRHAETEALKFWERGYAVICPHLNTQNFQGACLDDIWLEGDLELIRRSDIVYMLKGWQQSKGAQEEHQLALRLGHQILYEEEDLEV